MREELCAGNWSLKTAQEEVEAGNVLRNMYTKWRTCSTCHFLTHLVLHGPRLRWTQASARDTQQSTSAYGSFAMQLSIWDSCRVLNGRGLLRFRSAASVSSPMGAGQIAWFVGPMRDQRWPAHNLLCSNISRTGPWHLSLMPDKCCKR